MTTEDHEHARASSTPLNLRFEIVSCEFATTEWNPNSLIPSFQFRPPCIVGKDRPDQECRSCRHHRILTVGNEMNNRYLGYGRIFPVENDAVLQDIIDVLANHDALPLTRPAWGE